MDNTGDESIHGTSKPNVQFQDLPLDVLYTILWKLPPKEFARTSVLSTKWRRMWSMCPRLTFDGVAVCKCNRKDLEHILSHCSSLVWLHIDKCNLYDCLTVDTPLSNLLYLHIELCELTRIKFHALHSANIQFHRPVFQRSVMSLLNGLPMVQNLTFHIWWPSLEKQWLLDNPLKFSHLRNLQLLLMLRPQENDKVLYLVSFLRATPFIENLEVHFSGYALWLADVGPRRQDLGQWGKRTSRINFACVENAPALEGISVNTKQLASKEFWPYGGAGPPFEDAKRIAVTNLSATLREGVKLCVT
ncbi:hypothetical protein HU200_033095 [Digitaria exilis]|uniref:F-box domain-containing protein n=1 Tax=Digitaria exilis TaxID=1010633 RepID=A0A835ENH3_9POAL|nr:hypothetical protein HU200_033095 [Digitaria exilis]